MVSRENNKFLFFFIMVSSLPWVSFGTNSLDTQPWPLIYSLLVLFYLKEFKFKCDDLIWLIFPFIAVFLVVLNVQNLNTDTARSIANYIFFFVLLFSYLLINRFGINYASVIYKVNILYLVVSLCQLFLDPYLFEFLVSVRTTEGRGVTSLTPEPTYFGMYLLLTNLTYLLYFDYNLPIRINRIFKINIFFILFVAMSSMAIMYLFIGLFFYLMAKLNLKRLLQFVSLSVVSYIILETLISETRVYSVISILFDRGLLGVVETDASINDRFGNIVIPFYASFSNGFLPFGYGVFSDEYHSIKSIFNGFFWYGSGTKIQSFVNNFIFEMGFLAFIVFFLLYLRLFASRRWGLIEFSYIIIILLSALPVASPLIPLLLVSATKNKFHDLK